MNRSSLPKLDDNFSLISMGDIAFLLVLFFIALSTYVVTGGIKVSLPSSSTRDIERGIVSVSIDDKGNFFVNNNFVGRDSLEMALLSNKWVNEHKSFVIRADKKAPVEALVFVLDIAARNKLKTSVATVKKV